MKSKYYHYVGVQNDYGMSFVTKRDNANRTCFWNTEEKPLAMSHSVAEDTAFGLVLNGYSAVVVQSLYELTSHFVSKEKDTQ